MRALRRPPDRAQSSVLGTVLLIGVVLAVSLSIVVAGSTVMKTSQSAASLERATITFSEIDAAISQVGTDPTMLQGLSTDGLGNGPGDFYVEDEGQVRIVVNDTISDTEVFNETRTLGRIVYERDGEMVAYQGGGIWRKTIDGGNSAMISPPNFAFRTGNGQPTMVFPVINLEGNVSNDEFTVEQTNAAQLFPDGSSTAVPLEGRHRVEITIDTEFYKAWFSYIESQLDANVSVDHGTRTVSMAMSGPVATAGDDIGEAVVVTTGEQITNVGRIDSYRSSTGGWSGPFPERTNATVAVDDDIEINSNPQIGGDLIVTGKLRVTNDPTFYGDVVAGDSSSGVVRVITSPAVFEGLFSTKGDIGMGYSSGATFGEDVIVGGTLDQFGASSIGGHLHVGETARLDRGGSATLHANVTVGEDLVVASNVGFNATKSDQTIVAGGNVTFQDWGGTWNVDVVAGGNVTVPSGATLDGDVDAGGNVTVDGNVTGDVTAGGNISSATSNPTWTEYGDPEEPPMSRLRDPIEPTYPSFDGAADLIDSRGATLGSDNADHSSTIDDVEANGGCAGGCTLEAGSYNLSKLTIQPGESLTLDTSSGPIEMYVENDVVVKGTVDVTGSEAVRVYGDGNLRVEGSSAAVSTPNQDASQFWVYLKTDAKARFRADDPRFTGVVYGAGSDGGGANITATNSAVINGTVIGSLDGYNSNVEFHYDENLDGVNPFPTTGSGSANTVRYFHVDSQTIEVSG